MITQERDKRHFSQVEMVPIPATELVKILTNKYWESSQRLSSNHKATITEGKQFIELAIRGKEIVYDLIHRKRISGNLEAINTYDISRKVIASCEKCRQYPADELIGKIKDVFDQILVYNETDPDLEEGQVNINSEFLSLAIEFFSSLSKLPIDSLYRKYR